MAFISDVDARRTYDPEQGFELVDEGPGGGSSGYFPFQIRRGNQVLCQFWGKIASRQTLLRTNESDDKRRLVWVIYSDGWLLRPQNLEMKKVVEEAMISYGSFFGSHHAGYTYSVLFE